MTHHAEQEMDGPARTYTRRESLIRDCYDALLDRFDRFGGYLSMTLMAPKDLRSYVYYYVEDITTPSKDATEALWTLSLMTYICFYRFDGVLKLFKGFGRDISPTGSIFQTTVDIARKLNPDKQELIDSLQAAARQAQRVDS